MEEIHLFLLLFLDQGQVHTHEVEFIPPEPIVHAPPLLKTHTSQSFLQVLKGIAHSVVFIWVLMCSLLEVRGWGLGSKGQ